MTDAKAIFLRAIECTSPNERAQVIEEACGEDSGLRRRVEALLAAHDDPDSYLERPAAKFDVTATHDGSGSNLSDSSSSHHGRFLPGTKVAGRYRIVSMLGRGGMGEVYRADDLRLGQTVALKFLPPELAKDAKRLEYFHNEVRLARQIAHPNVCRVYDIGEIDGQHFISMEYIDGEDLKTLLHRIGRVPADKGVQIAQQLCAGLAAAHAKGVLHRDLKPANIMIDGQGQVRITDFGLATFAGDGENIIGMSGTPAYMASEQLLRGQTSVQSDIYSLGLTLYELLCGKPAHQANSIAEVRRFHESGSTPTPISQIVDGVGTAAERIVGKCLASDPFERPNSVRAIALALPGANPLLAAMDAGEVPSADLLAAFGTSVGPARWVANLLLATLIVSLAGIYFQSDRAYENNLASPTNPEVLTARAREIFDLLGYKNELADWDRGYFAVKDEPLQTKDTASGSLVRWKPAASPGKPGIRFWYRESPHRLIQNEVFSGERGSFTFGQVTYGSPKWYAGMRGLQLSPDGFLRELRCVPEDTVSTNTANSQMDWSLLLPQSLTGFDLASMKEKSWRMPTRGPADFIQSWEGHYPDSDTKCYVQAAAYRGRLSEFHSYRENEIVAQKRTSYLENPTDVRVVMFFVVAMLTTSVLLAVRNLRQGLGDIRGGVVLAGCIFLSHMLDWLLLASHTQHEDEIALMLIGQFVSAGLCMQSVLAYFAFEPLIRRYWPSTLVTWTRLLRGRLTDSDLRTDLLVGTLAATMIVLFKSVLRSFGLFPAVPFQACDRFPELAERITSTFQALHPALIGVVILTAAFMLVRSRPIAIVAACILWTLSDLFSHTSSSSAFHGETSLIVLLVSALSVGILASIFLKRGLLPFVTFFYVTRILEQPVTTETERYYHAYGVLALVAVGLIGYYGYFGCKSPGPDRRRSEFA